MAKEKKEYHSSQEGFGIAGFVLSLLTIIFAGGFGILMGVIAIIFCMRQQKKHPMKLAKAGIIISIIGIVFSILYILAMIFLGSTIQQQLGNSALPY
jgi:hypothetical protein